MSKVGPRRRCLVALALASASAHAQPVATKGAAAQEAPEFQWSQEEHRCQDALGHPGENRWYLGECGTFPGADLHDSDLSDLNLRGARLDGANLKGARLDGASLDHASMAGACLEGASLNGASLQGTSFERANLSGADLSNAVVSRTDFRGADLRGVTLAHLRNRVGAPETEFRAADSDFKDALADEGVLSALREGRAPPSPRHAAATVRDAAGGPWAWKAQALAGVSVAPYQWSNGNLPWRQADTNTAPEVEVSLGLMLGYLGTAEWWWMFSFTLEAFNEGCCGAPFIVMPMAGTSIRLAVPFQRLSLFAEGGVAVGLAVGVNQSPYFYVGGSYWAAQPFVRGAVGLSIPMHEWDFVLEPARVMGFGLTGATPLATGDSATVGPWTLSIAAGVARRF